MRCAIASIIPNLMLSSMSVMSPKSRIASRPSGVRIRFPGCGSAWKNPGVQQLLQVADHADVHQVADVVRGGLRQLLAVQPLGLVITFLRVHSHVRLRGTTTCGRSSLMDAAKFVGVLALLDVVQLLEEPLRPLVQQRHHVRVHLRHLSQREAQTCRIRYRSMDTVSSTAGPLHLHRDDVSPVVLQDALVHLPQARRRDRVRAELGVHVLPLAPELRFQGVERDLVIERRNFVAQLLELVHRRGGEDVRANRQRLPELDVRRAQGRDDVPELNRALHAVLLRPLHDDIGQNTGDEPARDGRGAARRAASAAAGRVDASTAR